LSRGFYLIYNIEMEERFWSKVDKTETCWLWTGSKRKDGYGRFKVNGQMQLPHRVAWILSGKTIPEGHVIRHKCLNKNCVNPEHLETGTVAENNADKIRDGTTNRGIKNPKVKLTEEQVREIRVRVDETQTFLAEEYGVCDMTIWRIINRKRWAWLE
jgi:hypothetical protein